MLKRATRAREIGRFNTAHFRLLQYIAAIGRKVEVGGGQPLRDRACSGRNVRALVGERAQPVLDRQKSRNISQQTNQQECDYDRHECLLDVLGR